MNFFSILESFPENWNLRQRLKHFILTIFDFPKLSQKNHNFDFFLQVSSDRMERLVCMFVWREQLSQQVQIQTEETCSAPVLRPPPPASLPAGSGAHQRETSVQVHLWRQDMKKYPRNFWFQKSMDILEKISWIWSRSFLIKHSSLTTTTTGHKTLYPKFCVVQNYQIIIWVLITIVLNKYPGSNSLESYQQKQIWALWYNFKNN